MQWSRRRETQPRYPGRHPAAFDADEQLGQRSGQKRGGWQGAYGVVPELCRPAPLDPDSSKDVKSPVEPWWDVWTNQAELRPRTNLLQYAWGRWRDYDDGGVNWGVTGYGTHNCDQINRAGH